MPLTPERRTIDKKLTANRVNGRQSRGAVTPEGKAPMINLERTRDRGKARAPMANLCHGLYSLASTEVLIGLGEDPEECNRLVKSLGNRLAEGLGSQLVGSIARALWRLTNVLVKARNGALT